jgi:hypothetical protein
MFKYFLSNIRLIKADGTEQKIPNTYFLVDHAKPASKMLDLFDVPEGNYTGIRFTIGIDSIDHTIENKTLLELADNNGMYWPTPWFEYIHLKLEGNVKPNDSLYVIHIAGHQGLNSNYKHVTIPFSNNGGGSYDELKIVQGKKPTLHLYTNLMEIFLDQNNNPINITVTPSVTSTGPEATILANGYSNMIIYSHLHNE